MADHYHHASDVQGVAEDRHTHSPRDIGAAEEYDLDRLKDEVSSLRSDIRDLERELRELRNEVRERLDNAGA